MKTSTRNVLYLTGVVAALATRGHTGDRRSRPRTFVTTLVAGAAPTTAISRDILKLAGSFESLNIKIETDEDDLLAEHKVPAKKTAPRNFATRVAVTRDSPTHTACPVASDRGLIPSIKGDNFSLFGSVGRMTVTPETSGRPGTSMVGRTLDKPPVGRV